ncbi:MAG TPA: tryptophan-rich sensory protein [Chitinophagales bacterium]|nr:tryptophan-rich sensory protein [Chitinophagales bacterium]
MNIYLKLFISIIVCLAVGGISGYLTTSEITTWYATLQKPSFNPPNYLFGPVWTILYIMMAISFWLIWKSDASESLKNKAILLFGIQLILNFFWSIIFFRFHQLGFAFAEIIAMWVFILLSILAFYPVSKPAAIMLIPYLCWVSFATVLNFSIWRLN